MDQLHLVWKIGFGLAPAWDLKLIEPLTAKNRRFESFLVHACLSQPALARRNFYLESYASFPFLGFCIRSFPTHDLSYAIRSRVVKSGVDFLRNE